MKRFFLRISLLILLLFNLKAYSQKWEIDLTVGTWHYQRDYLWYGVPQRFSEFNPGVIVQRDISHFKIGGGYIKNSYDKDTWIGTIGYNLTSKVSVNLGLATGYGHTDMDMDLLPVGMVSYRFKNFKIGLSPQFLLYSFNFRL